MKKREQLTLRLLILLAVLAPLLVLALLGQEFIMNAVIIPVEYFFWMANLVVRAVSQNIFWAVTCAVAVLLVFLSLLAGSKEPPQSEDRLPSRSARERVAFWVLQLHLAKGGSYSRLRFADLFSRLILDVLSYSGRISPGEVEQGLKTSSLDIPQPVLVYLKIRLTPLYALAHRSIQQDLGRRWLRLLEIFKRKPKNTVDQFEEDVRQVVQYLENELEVDRHHDGH